jgi:DNA-binding GntR family transcriptional regulator
VASLRSGDGDHAAEVVAAHIERSHQLLRERMDENGNVDN